jgi:AcrR family transcriptional regulator
MRGQPDKTKQTKQDFLDAFCKLYSKKPIEKITVQEITKKAGYNRCTFYQYFSNVYEILDYIENDVFDYFQRNAPKEKSAELKSSAIQEFSKLFEEKGTYINALLGNYRNNRFTERLKKKIPYIQEMPLLKENPVMPYLIEFHLSTTLSLFRLWQHRKKDLSTDEFSDLIISLYTKGISTFY